MDDSKQYPRCYVCVRGIKWIPVCFIVAILAWSYYAYIFELCISTIEEWPLKILYVLLYHIFFVFLLWSYWQTVATPIGTVPPKWKISRKFAQNLAKAQTPDQQKLMLEQFSKDLPVCNRTAQGVVRLCDKCAIVKPDRAHHCSVCGCCVLKMDHHCPWVNNCVNFNNYKYFVLFLGYALLYCLFVGLTSLQYFVKFWRGELNDRMGKFHILFLFFISIMFALSLVSLFGYHIYLVLMNRTTLESFRAPIFRNGGPDKNGYNLGKLANFQEVFGDNWKLWFLPIYTSLGDGQLYRMRTPQTCSLYESMGATSTSFGDGISYPVRHMNEDTESLLGTDHTIEIDSENEF